MPEHQVDTFLGAARLSWNKVLDRQLQRFRDRPELTQRRFSTVRQLDQALLRNSCFLRQSTERSPSLTQFLCEGSHDVVDLIACNHDVSFSICFSSSRRHRPVISPSRFVRFPKTSPRTSNVSARPLSISGRVSSTIGSRPTI